MKIITISYSFFTKIMTNSAGRSFGNYIKDIYIYCKKSYHTNTKTITNKQIIQPNNKTLKSIVSVLVFLALLFCTNISLAATKTTHPNNTFWTQLSKQFHLETNNPAVRAQIKWLQKHPTFLKHAFANAVPYIYYVEQEVNKHHMPAELTLLPIIESAYNPLAGSHAGAAGIWQFMPSTASGYGVKQNWWYDGRKDIVTATPAALKYLQYLSGYFNHNWLLAMAAYDSGEGQVRSAINKNKHAHKSTNYWNLPLPRETKDYVPRLLAMATMVKNPSKYGLHLPHVPNTPYITTVKVNRQINLDRAAKLAHMTPKELNKYNPAYKHWATAPGSDYTLIIPIKHAATFKANYAKLSHIKSTNWKRYTVTKGDNLLKIANKFKTTEKLIQLVNNIKGHTIYPKQKLLIPVATKTLSSSIIDTVSNDLQNGDAKSLQPVIYEVKSGDTLNNIAAQYHTSVSAISYWNQLHTTSLIYPNQEIVIWP